jgi:hypothetical protein
VVAGPNPAENAIFMKKQYKVERKPNDPRATWYEVMLSPFSSLKDVHQYIEKYQQYYPVEERNYRITEY